MRNHIIPGIQSEHNPPGSRSRFRYVVKNILLSERADWEYPGEQAFVEMELARLTENGEEILSLFRDSDGDYEVVLKVEVGGGI